MAKNSNWDDDKIKQLIELYNEGRYSTKQIGEMLGFSKNAIVGKIHRLEINKIKPLNEQNNIVNEEIIEELSDAGEVDNNNYIPHPNHIVGYQTDTVNNAGNFILSSEQRQKYYRLEEISLNMCVWPYGEEKFTFCGVKAIVGKPYCQEHFEKAYLKFNKRSSNNNIKKP